MHAHFQIMMIMMGTNNMKKMFTFRKKATREHCEQTNIFLEELRGTLTEDGLILQLDYLIFLSFFWLEWKVKTDLISSY